MSTFINNFTVRNILLLSALASSSVLFAECKAPEPPIAPNGMTADRDTIIAATVSVKSYIAENEDYRLCLKKELDALGDSATAEQKAEWGKRHDASVDTEEQTAAGFNAQIRIFKSR